MGVKVKLNRGGMATMLNSSEVTEATREQAEAIATRARMADTVQRHSAPVVVESYTARGGRLASPRTAFAVMIDHWGGKGIEAKYGVLSRAAGGGS